MSAIRADAMRHLVNVRELLSRVYLTDALRGALDSLEEALHVEPIEAERNAILEIIWGRADRHEQGDLEEWSAQEALVAVADLIAARDNHPHSRPEAAA